MSESGNAERDQQRCHVCGGPVGHADVGQFLDRRSGSGVSPLVRAIDDYIEKWEEADRLSLAYCERIDELKRQGFEDDPVYFPDGVYLRMHYRDLQRLRKHLDVGVAAARDAAARAVAERRRVVELDRAQAEIERWHRAVSALGIPELCEASAVAWEAVDRVDFGSLMRSEPSSMVEVLAMLRLIVQVGWYGCDTGDAEIPIRALAGIIRFLEQ